MNKRILINDYMTVQGLEEEMPDLIVKVSQEKVVLIDMLLKIMRQMLFFFLNEVSICSIITSRRISNMSKRAHL